MINFPGGRSISTIVISTACGYDGRGIFPYTCNRDYGDMIRAANATSTTRISKSMTRHKRNGNFHLWRPWTWKYIQDFDGDGMLNAYGLTNKGALRYLRFIGDALVDGIQIIPSIYPEFDQGKEVAKMGIFHILAQYEFWGSLFWAVELNFSCPNTRECIADNIKSATWLVEKIKEIYPKLIVIAKISVAHPPKFAKMLSEAGADVIHSANTVPWGMLFGSRSPLEKVGGGGISGGPAFQKALDFNKEVLAYYEGPIILGCGIVDDEKLLEYQRLVPGYGRNAVFPAQVSFGVCTAALRRPEWVTEQVRELNS